MQNLELGSDGPKNGVCFTFVPPLGLQWGLLEKEGMPLLTWRCG